MRVKCKTCGVEKERTKIGQRKTSSIFADWTGKTWHGTAYCPSCNVERMNKRMKEKRAK